MEEIRNPGLPEGREAVAALAASGQSIKAYCESSGQSEWSMRRWRAEFGEALGVPIKRRPGAPRHRVKRHATLASPTTSTLVPILLTANAGPTDQSVEIRLRGERTVIVSAGVDVGLLSRLIGAIERAS